MSYNTLVHVHYIHTHVHYMHYIYTYIYLHTHTHTHTHTYTHIHTYIHTYIGVLSLFIRGENALHDAVFPEGKETLIKYYGAFGEGLENYLGIPVDVEGLYEGCITLLYATIIQCFLWKAIAVILNV